MCVVNKHPHPHPRHPVTAMVEMCALQLENVLLGYGATCYFSLYFHKLK